MENAETVRQLLKHEEARNNVMKLKEGEEWNFYTPREVSFSYTRLTEIQLNKEIEIFFNDGYYVECDLCLKKTMFFYDASTSGTSNEFAVCTSCRIKEYVSHLQ